MSLELVYYVSDGCDENDGSVAPAVLGLLACMGSVKCGILPLSKNEVFNDMPVNFQRSVSQEGLISGANDSEQSIGQRIRSW